MLQWLKDNLSIADSMFAVVGGLLVYCIGPLRERWKRRPSARRARQSAALDNLGLGRPLDAVEAELGRPYLLHRREGAEGEIVERIYRLFGAWVSLRAPGGAVAAFAITVTDPEAAYDTGGITRGIVPVQLGQSVFSEAREDTTTVDSLENYARFATFHRYYPYGALAAGGQFIWLGFNPSGAGTFAGADTADLGVSFTAMERAAQCDLSRITVNTIAVCGWELHQEAEGLGVYGPHPDLIR